MKGLIFIPDISGFTNFVQNTDIDLGAFITLDLFNEIINSNPLDLELTEIEGDALLFYRVGEPIPLKDLLSGFKSIFHAFNTRFKILKAKYNLDVNLSLKCIVHYGEIKVYKIRGFRNLFGKAVIESHNLLKNGCGESEYILITGDYLNALENNSSDVHYTGYEFISSYSTFMSTFRSIPYCYFRNSERQSFESTKISSTTQELNNSKLAFA